MLNVKFTLHLLPCVTINKMYMNNKILFPNKCKVFGWALFVFVFILWIIPDNRLEPFFDLGKTNYLFTVRCLLSIVSGILISFSKEKVEDEFISSLRLSSWMWAVFVNYVFLALSVVFVYDIEFLSVVFYNMFTTLLIFILRFNILLWRYSTRNENE